jgi:effector-binding domain-containing protein
VVAAIETRVTPEQAVLSVRRYVDERELPAWIGRAIGDLVAESAAMGAAPVGPPVAVYHYFGPPGLDVEVCLPVDHATQPNEPIRAHLVPAADVAVLVHAGPYERIGDAYSALTNWLERHDRRQVGPFRERYLVGPAQTPEPSAFRTEVEVPIAPARATAGLALAGSPR